MAKLTDLKDWGVVNLRDNVSEDEREPSQKTMDDLLEACDTLRAMGIHCGVNNGDFPGVIFNAEQVQKLIALLSNIEVFQDA